MAIAKGNPICKEVPVNNARELAHRRDEIFAARIFAAIAGWHDGCSTGTNFIVINSLDQILHVSYKVKEPPPALKDSIRMLPTATAVKSVSEVGEETAWRDLSESQVQFDRWSRTAVAVFRGNTRTLDASTMGRRGYIDGRPHPRHGGGGGGVGYGDIFSGKEPLK